MKKIFMVFALMAMLMLPFTSFSMTAMEEGDLSSVTGQAGVSINLDVRVDLKADTLAWGDGDGFTSPGQAVTGNDGWVGLSGLVVDNLRIRVDQVMLNGDFVSKKGTAYYTAAGTLIAAFNTASGYSLPYATPAQIDASIVTAMNVITATPALQTALATYITAYQSAAVAYANAGATYGADATKLMGEITSGQFTPFAPLTIDVATGTGAAGDHGAGITYVRIGLGSLEVKMSSMVADVELGPAAGFPGAPVTGTPDLKYQLGSLYLGNLGLRIGGNSYVDIFNARPAGEQGVSIYANVTIKDFAIGTLAWGDADGIDWHFTNEPGDTAGTTKLHTTDTELETPASGDADPIADGAGWVGLKDLNIARIDIAGQVDIDVATDGAGWTFVQIGLGANQASGLNVQLSGLQATAALGNAATNLSQELGELYVSGVNVTVWGALQLGARADGTQGVTIDLQDISVALSGNLTVSWGDLDGLTGVADAAGYVGLTGLNIAGLSLAGKVTIDVATIDQAATTTATTPTELMYLGYRENNLSPTIVHIGLGTGSANDDTMDAGFNFVGDALGVSITSLMGNVVFDSVPGLNLTPNVMGMLYASGIKVGINGWVDIAAH